MSEDFKEKIKSLGFPRKFGQTEKKPVINELNGTVGGYHTIRWDGSQDAHVIPTPVKSKGKAMKVEEE